MENISQHPYFNLTIIEFLDYITEKKLEYTLQVDHGHALGGDSIHGTKDALISFVMKDASPPKKVLELFSDMHDYQFNFQLSDLEIYTYLEYKTGGFEYVKVKLLLKEFECYYIMDYEERLNSESKAIYEKEGWELPTTDIPPLTLDLLQEQSFNEITKMVDIKAMVNKTHGVELSFGLFARTTKLLKEKMNLKEESERNTASKPLQEKNPYAETFTPYGSQLFIYLDKHFTQCDDNLPTKYSSIFHFIKEHRHEHIFANKTDWKKFVQKNNLIEKLAKVMDKTGQYDDKYCGQLAEHLRNFDLEKGNTLK